MTKLFSTQEVIDRDLVIFTVPADRLLNGALAPVLHRCSAEIAVQISK